MYFVPRLWGFVSSELLFRLSRFRELHCLGSVFFFCCFLARFFPVRKFFLWSASSWSLTFWSATTIWQSFGRLISSGVLDSKTLWCWLQLIWTRSTSLWRRLRRRTWSSWVFSPPSSSRRSTTSSWTARPTTSATRSSAGSRDFVQAARLVRCSVFVFFFDLFRPFHLHFLCASIQSVRFF